MKKVLGFVGILGVIVFGVVAPNADAGISSAIDSTGLTWETTGGNAAWFEQFNVTIQLSRCVR